MLKSHCFRRDYFTQRIQEMKSPVFFSAIRIFLAGCLAACALGVSRVQAQGNYTWRDCLEEAKEHHPDLLSAREGIHQTQADKGITAGGLFPQVSGNFAGTSSQKASSDPAENYSYGITGSQLLFDGFKKVHQVKESEQAIVAETFRYMVTSSNVRLRLRKAFIEILKEQELLEITDEIAKRRHESVELVQLRYDAGREHKGALLQAQANLAQAQADAAQAGRSISLAQRRLGKELGRSRFEAMQARGDFEVADPQRQLPEFEFLAETTPFLKELMARQEAARHGLRSAKADYFPEVFANADMSRSETRWPPGDEAWSVGVKVTLPFWDGGIRRGTLRKAESVLTQAQAEERGGRDGVTLILHETWARHQDALDNVEVQRKFLESAEARAKISEAQYSNGLILFDDWIIIEDTLVRVKKDFIEAQANALITEADWVQAKGGTLENEY